MVLGGVAKLFLHQCFLESCEYAFHSGGLQQSGGFPVFHKTWPYLRRGMKLARDCQNNDIGSITMVGGRTNNNGWPFLD